MDKKLTWLHLSDLHLTCRKSGNNDWTTESINQDIVIQSLLEAIQNLLIKKGQKLNLIFITGDLVHGGKEEEYEVAGEFCRQLLKITGLSTKQLFIVPGNHDVNREAIKKVHMDGLYKFNNQDDISERLSDSELFPILIRKLDGFYKFCKNFLYLDVEPKQQYIFGKTIKIIGTPLEINLLGLNSALFAGYDGDDNHKLAFGLYQSQQAFNTLNKDAHLSIAFFHHPFSCFHECEVPIQNQLKQKVDLILTGHLHSPSNMSQRDSSGKAVIIGAGASYETRESENSFNVGVLDLETGEGKVQFYKYIKNQFRWTKNTEINLDEDDDGRFPFVISSLQERPLFIPKKFICQKIKDGEFLDLSSVNYMYGYSMNSIELDKEQSVFCTLYLPNAQSITPTQLQNHNAIVAICVCNKDEVLNELSANSNSPISKIMKHPINKLTNEEKKEIFMA
ncbi:MAG: metallophosphoesterase family protein, partial [Mucilaginibacter sp.]